MSKYDIQLIISGYPVDLLDIDIDLLTRIVYAVSHKIEIVFNYKDKEFYMNGAECTFYMFEKYDEDGMKI